MAYNAGELLEDLNAKLQGHPRFTSDIKFRAINKALDWLVLGASDNEDVWEAGPVVDPDDTSKYLMEVALPANIFFVKSVSFDGYPIKMLTQQEFVNTRAEFSTATGPPFSGCYIRANAYLNVWPRPGSSAADKLFQVYGVFKPTDMDEDADVPALARAFTEAALQYALYWCKDGIPGWEESSKIHLVNAYRERAEVKFHLQNNVPHKIGRVRP